MLDALRFTLVALGLALLATGGYYRIRSQRSGEALDRTREGWPLLIGIRLLGLLTAVSTAAWLWTPAWFEWASLPVPLAWRWIGVTGLAADIAWLIWMFQSLGLNLTDTVVTRRNAFLVGHGPYRFVRNPMYLGILVMGATLGLALGTWLLPVLEGATFTLLALRTQIEERYLIERFGAHYQTYMNRVGRFFPKPPSWN